MRRVLLLAALLLAACQQPPALMAGGNYAGAVEKFRQAIDLEPASVSLS